MIKDLKYEDLKEQGFDVDEGFTYTGSSEKYLAALQRFYRRSGKTTGYIREMSGEGQYEELTIVVHALKSNARTIGADHLAGLAEQMELLGMASSYAEMSAFKDELLSEIENIVEYGTRLNLDYYIKANLDEDVVEEIYDYFRNEAQSDSVADAIKALGPDYEEIEIRLVRLKFLSEVAN